jgi:type III secretory pathway lipoprotein EscJ
MKEIFMCRIKGFLISVFVTFSVAGCYERDVMHGLSEREANSLISRLGDSGIEAEKLAEGKDTWSVRVERSVAARAIKIISRVNSLGTEPAEEERGGLFLSKEDRKFNLARVLARDIEQTLVVLSGIHEAKVHLKFPDKDPFLAGFADSSSDQPVDAGSASALIIAENGNRYNKKDIADLISGASGIPAERVSVWLTINEIGEADERFDIKGEGIVQEGLKDSLLNETKSDRPAEEAKSQGGPFESFRNGPFDESTHYIGENPGISIGVVLITISVIILTCIRINRAKDHPLVIPNFVP